MTAAESAPGPPLKPYPKVADTQHAGTNNGVKRPPTVSAGTQTDPVKIPTENAGSESASWDHAGPGQTEWDNTDQNSKPGLLGMLLFPPVLIYKSPSGNQSSKNGCFLMGA